MIRPVLALERLSFLEKEAQVGHRLPGGDGLSGVHSPEGTSNSLALLAGRISGITFIFGMDALKSPATEAMTPSLLTRAVLTAVSVILTAMLPESPVHRGSNKRQS
jgi:hypothetical protein